MQVFKEQVWEKLKWKFIKYKEFYLVPYIRRCFRFIALPYCYLYMVNWNECKESKIKVALDFLYIFFILKYFPDNYSLCRLWEKNKEEWVYYYGSNYDPYQRRQLRRLVQKKEYEIIFEDKNVCYQMCKAGELPLPKQIACVENSTECIEVLEDQLYQYPNQRYLIKPVNGSAGSGIILIWKDKGDVLTQKNNIITPLRSISIDKTCVIQEYLKQHSEMGEIFSGSVNTIRIVTLMASNCKVLFLGAFVRFGVDNAFIDNTSQGGIAVGIDIENGKLKEYGYDFNSRKHFVHLSSGIKFRDRKIPMWNSVMEIAKKTQNYFNYFKLLGHDIAIKEDGPVIIELNSIYDNVGLEQSCGPILKKNKILHEYAKYDLLINRKQKMLAKNININ